MLAIPWSPKATDSLAGDNATGIDGHPESDPEGVAQVFGIVFDPFGVGSLTTRFPVALPPAIESVAFGDVQHTVAGMQPAWRAARLDPLQPCAAIDSRRERRQY